MDGCCGGGCGTGGGPSGRQTDYRRTLRLALLVSALLCVVALTAGGEAQSMALRALALDLLARATGYGFSLWVLGRALEWRPWATVARGVALGGLGLWVLGGVVWSAGAGVVPDAPVIGLVGLLALAANVAVATRLFAGRRRAASLRSVWLCARNDVLGNAAVLLAALGVWSTGTGWPDLVVATGIAGLSLAAAGASLVQAADERRAARGAPSR